MEPLRLMDNDEARRAAGVRTDAYRCPLCVASTTDDDTDIGWYQCPILKKAQILCYGCCYEISEACIASNFENHVLLPEVQQAADLAGISIREARKICVRHQLETIRVDPDYWPKPEEVPAAIVQLEALLRKF